MVVFVSALVALGVVGFVVGWVAGEWVDAWEEMQ